MQKTIMGKVWAAFRAALGRVMRAGLGGLVAGFMLVEGLAAVLNKTVGDASGITLTWPPTVNISAPTFFVHLMAVITGLLLAYLLAFTVAVVQTLRGIFFAAEHADDVVATVVDKGLDVADAAVDAVDGPERHGFRGKRDAVSPLR